MSSSETTYKHPFIRRHLMLDLSDCYTWSFPEFLPFCAHLYDFSSFKDFKGFTA